MKPQAMEMYSLKIYQKEQTLEWDGPLDPSKLGKAGKWWIAGCQDTVFHNTRWHGLSAKYQMLQLTRHTGIMSGKYCLSGTGWLEGENNKFLYYY